ncbi:hypothetical protein FGF80_18680 (plasmid) [Natrinema pallidum]|uniref:Uncharacterized protein n=1 Tax=Natrinema pallidum TaxID=69527 RepID=A0A4P9TMI0_9EURY|nr:hypothetical protein FGF80_18680 [Natrinema pallidum]
MVTGPDRGISPVVGTIALVALVTILADGRGWACSGALCRGDAGGVRALVDCRR